MRSLVTPLDARLSPSLLQHVLAQVDDAERFYTLRASRTAYVRRELDARFRRGPLARRHYVVVEDGSHGLIVKQAWCGDCKDALRIDILGGAK